MRPPFLQAVTSENILGEVLSVLGWYPWALYRLQSTLFSTPKA
jgi:hypothetical protein